MTQSIGFIGGGNLARSMIRGLLAHGYTSDAIWVSDPNHEKCTQLRETFHVHTTSDNLTVVQHADILILAVKPDKMHFVAKEIASLTSQLNRLIISVAAGIRCEALSSWLQYALLIRAMPNTAASLGCSATALFAMPSVTKQQQESAQAILESIGMVLWVDDEDKIDTVTALSGSGPAYFFLVMEAMQEAGEKLGLDKEQASTLVLQTALGSAKMALEGHEPIAKLRQHVTSPQGTTEQAITYLQNNKINELFYSAISAAKNRAKEIASQFSKEQS